MILNQTSKFLFDALLKPSSILSTSSSCQTRSLSSNPSVQFVKSITLRTCVGIYDRLRQTWPHLYRKSPQEGLDLTTNYFDSANDPTRTKFDKVIVIVHGNPGYVSHFSRQIEHFHKHRPSVRVIVPNLPDFSHTRSSGGAYWHSTVEKAAFLKDFLKSLNIDQIDCLVAHSFGVQSAAVLWGEPDHNIDIKSVALFAPQSLWKAYDHRFRHMTPIFYIRHELWYKLLDLLRIHRSTHWPMTLSSINEFLLISTLLLDHQSPVDLHRRVDYLLNNTKLPIGLMYGDRDVLVHPESAKEVNRKFGFPPKELVHIDASRDTNLDAVMRKHTSQKRIHSFMVHNGGHMTHAKYHLYANRMIENLMNL